MPRKKCELNKLKYPASDKISGRNSTICRSMACTLIERKPCSAEDEQKWKKFFPDKKCAYCGEKASHLDHLYPLIINRMPTGYGTEPANLVPCCAACNQPKGNKDWKEYMDILLGKCKTKQEKKEHTKRIDTIKTFLKAMPPTKVTLTLEMEKKWNDLLTVFDNGLKKAEKELLDIHNKLYKDKK